MIVSFTTLGCKTNQFETGALQALLVDRGHQIAAPGEIADAVVVNTCAVTAESSRKSRQAVRRGRAEHPGAIIAVCGCLSQLSPAEIEALEADLIYGTADREAFVTDLEQAVAGASSRTVIDEANTRNTFEILPPGGMDGRVRALLKVQDGCDNYCTYCIIPYARGPVRSIPLETAVEQAKELAQAGYRELVITGIEISSYGKDHPDGPDVVDLIAAVCQAAPGLRIRLGSLEPRTVTTAFCERLAEFPNLCPHFHLSLQSGSDETLTQMGRKYTTVQYTEALTHLRKTFPNCAVTTDLIVGFPGESEADFLESITFLRTAAFAAVHVFPYSAREGTAAAKMPNQIPKPERRRRAKAAGEVVRGLEQTWHTAQVGQVMDVLFESEAAGQCRGHTPNYCTVLVRSTGLENQIRPVRIIDVSEEGLIGELML
ncbi:MAG: tRNA (N(6)-L-threonylcarbamoyladenosine(37)-C(2))-methylthiotransferase MtaB [Oscillospiraceae bacterium]|nr:tRNA (N(6)-L-threonylcarbamoyladenosine(37)-C(2))-methylthiotransferase MtaB [Oscillospiraceae bacterium]